MWGRVLWRRGVILAAGMGVAIWTSAQTADGNQGLSDANNMIRGYYAMATNLMFAIGAILGIIGAIKVFSIWINGEQHMGRVAAMWFSACIFLVVVATIIKSFFGIS
jgi:hypothetical protein